MYRRKTLTGSPGSYACNRTDKTFAFTVTPFSGYLRFKNTTFKGRLHQASMFIWIVNINACIISDQLGLQTIFGVISWFIKKSKQFNQSNIANDITALTLTPNANGPFIMVCSICGSTFVAKTFVHNLTV